VRRLALGLLAALLCARAFWPSEPDLRSGAGAGLAWVLALFLVFGLALAASLVAGTFRFRWSWGDLACCALCGLVAHSATHAVDRRVALNLAWEWVALGGAYLLVRNLPRARIESSALGSALVATAVAVSAYGLYQTRVELPQLRAHYQRNPAQVLRTVNIEPGSHGELVFKDRLLGSTEVWSTFALPNSLAGFIVGPLVLLLAVGFWNLANRSGASAPWAALCLAAPAALVLLLCLLLTKCLSAFVGLLASLGLLAWRARRRVPARLLWTTGLAGLFAVAALAGIAVANGRLDSGLLTQAARSLRYRWEYCQGAWGVITGGNAGLQAALSSPFLWSGVGPGNFGAAYLKHKLPVSSEEILDPHNLFLEVWATAGFWALFALLAALAIGLWNALCPGAEKPGAMATGRDQEIRVRGRSRMTTRTAPLSADADWDDVADAAPGRTGWLTAAAGAGWILAVVVGQLNPFQGDLFYRWLILGASWLAAALMLAPLWRRLSMPALAPGAAAAAVAVTLLAAGGIGIPSVALALWSLLALALNLRDDRGCGRLRAFSSRMPALGLAALWAALLGTFLGVTMPYWRCQQALALAEEAMTRRPPDYDRAEESYGAAITADRYDPRPWRGLAYLNWAVWQERGAKIEDQRWKTIPPLLRRAASPPRNPFAWSLHTERAHALGRLLETLSARIGPREALPLRAEIVEAARDATRLYPSSADLHAELAEASAAISMYQDAVTEASEALRLDQLTPHLDRKLPDAVRTRLTAQIPSWSQSAASMTPTIKAP
jgi:tetratricopeptide (TPR) repeat protein